MSKSIEVNIILELLAPDELSEIEKDLIDRAVRILENAHAPYSNFLVGASLLLDNGEIYSANNQENVSFPVGLCAERAVLSYALGNAIGAKPIKLAIAARRRNDMTMANVTPCGLCRQTINEYEIKFGHPIEILMLNSNGEILKAKTIEQLLPFRFNDLNS
jgi:cytidine deaminase